MSIKTRCLVNLYTVHYTIIEKYCLLWNKLPRAVFPDLSIYTI